jgi:hypothetical protein
VQILPPGPASADAPAFRLIALINLVKEAFEGRTRAFPLTITLTPNVVRSVLLYPGTAVNFTLVPSSNDNGAAVFIKSFARSPKLVSADWLSEQLLRTLEICRESGRQAARGIDAVNEADEVGFGFRGVRGYFPVKGSYRGPHGQGSCVQQ